MHEQPSTAAEHEERIEAEILEAAAMVGMKVGHGHGMKCGRDRGESRPRSIPLRSIFRTGWGSR